MYGLLFLLATLLATPARANVPCSVPFNLQNGVVADANQVMANYNAILACLVNAAAAGVNSDITSLTALSTPIPFTSGGSSIYVGGTSTGSANAQVVASTTPIGFSLTAGKRVTFVAGFTNTDVTTLNVNATGAKNLYRRTQLGISTAVGGEVIAGQLIEAQYDGTQFQLLGEVYYVGKGDEWFGASAPPGWALADGSCQLRAGVFADLFSVIGTTYDPTGSTCDGTHFAMPDGRGRGFFGKDNMGGVAANRLTNMPGSLCAGNVIGGAGCGAQNYVLNQANLPNVNFAVTGTAAAQTLTQNKFGISNGTIGADPNFLTTGGSSLGMTNASSAVTGNAASGGIGSPTITIPPLQVVNKIVKY